MLRPLRSHFILLPWLVVMPLAACESAGSAEAWTGTVDTLANGAVHVRSPATGLWAPGDEWRVVEDLRIGRREGAGPEVFGDLTYLVVDDAGRMWAMDRSVPEIRVFDADGGFVRSVGRRGAGPGEFADALVPMIRDRAGDVWVSDWPNRRWQRFDSAGEFVRSYPTLTPSNSGVRVWGADGRLREGRRNAIDPAAPSHVVTGMLATEGDLVVQDTFQVPGLPDFQGMDIRRPGGDVLSRLPIPLTHVPGRVMGPAGDFWSWDGDGVYRITHARIEGDTLAIIERDSAPVEASDSAREAELPDLDPQRFSMSIGVDDVPSTYPPFRYVYPAQDGHLWVSRKLADGPGFDVFDGDGRFLGSVPAEHDGGRLTITDTHLYAIEQDEFGVDYLVRYRIEKPGGG